MPSHLARAATADETARAREKLQSGARALDDGDYEQALADFQSAFQIVPSPKIQFDFGLAYTGLARHADALEAFERFLGEAKDASAATRADAERHVASLRLRVGTLSITSNRDGAEVRIDGRKVGTTPLGHKLYIQPGSHEIVAQRGSSPPFVQDFTASAGVDLSIAVKLAEKSPELAIRPPPQGPVSPALVRTAASAPSDETASGGNRWLWWTLGGGAVVAAAVVLVIVLGRSTSYPTATAMVNGN